MTARKMILSLALVFAVALAATARGQEGEEAPGAEGAMGGGGRGRGMHMMRGMGRGGGGGGAVDTPDRFALMLRESNLSEEQQTKLHGILDANRNETKPLTEKLRSTKDEIASKMLGSGKVSAADLKSLQKQAEDLQHQIDSKSIDASLQIRSMLTPDQLSKAAGMHQKMAEMRAQMEQRQSQ